MPPKASTNDGKAEQMYSADVVAAVLMATGTTSLPATMKHYEIMSSLDGVKTASAFQHDFRSVLAKAKQLKARVEKGAAFESVAPATKRATKQHPHLPDTLLHSSLLHLPSRPTHNIASLAHPNLIHPLQATMGKTTDSPAAGQKMIPADCVSVLLMALGSNTITKEQLNMMSAIDGTRTASSFEHQFRSIVAKAKELKKRVEDGETFAPVQPSQKRGTATPTTPRKRKGDDVDETPTKKPKTTPKPRAKKAQAEASSAPQPADDDVKLPADMDAFIKSEKQWEEKSICLRSWDIHRIDAAHDFDDFIFLG
ncbi:hypothetical protein E8E12_011438 [Didymella heteroderae]|uniref:Uncharacterized protein n=1 Tax=Didymella heteroderae TaxID=1769908 RepID=A0A9P5C4L7_9PLEO|nr:hypothetical protein E8E12_011438 [Didymella heteroderae]